MVRLAFLLLLVVSAHILYAQDFPVDHHTGRPIINIPLLRVNDRNLMHGVGLSYDPTGVKINAPSGWVGTNWTLVAGGQVTRELRGFPDELNETTQKGWLFNSNASTIGSHSYLPDLSGLDCDDEDTEHTFISGFGFDQDSEPDLFHFSAGDISGSFVFDNSGSIDSIKLVPYQDLHVEATIQSDMISIFVITTAAGVKYTFSQETGEIGTAFRSASKGLSEADPFYFRKEYHQYKNGVTYIPVWRLQSIESPVGETITFQYVSNDSTSLISGQSISAAVGGSGTNDPPVLDLYSLTDEMNSIYRLYSITTPHQVVVFNTVYSALTADNLLLQSIVVNEITPLTSTFVKEINFGYTGPVNRRFLRIIRTRDNCELYDPIKFEYNSWQTLPAPGSEEEDIWGYHYDHGAPSKFPTVYIYPNDTGIYRMSLYPREGAMNEIVIPGADRVGGATPVAGVLSRILFPTGASTAFNFESHDFYNPLIDTISQGGGLRLSSMIIHDGISNSNDITRTFEYKKSDSTSSGKLLTLPTFWQLSGCFRSGLGSTTTWSTLSGLPAAEQWDKLLIRTKDNINPDFYTLPSVVYERVTEKISAGHGRIVYEFDVPYTYGSEPDNTWNPTYTHIARRKVFSTCINPGHNLPGYYQHPFPPQTLYSFGRGMPLKTSWYAEGEADPLREVINEFEDKTVSAETVKGLRYEYIPYSSGATSFYFMYSMYTIGTNTMKVLSASTERVRSREAPYTYMETVSTYNYDGNHGFITSSTATGSNGELFTKRFRYAKDFGAPQATNGSTPLQVKMIDALNTNNQGGTLIEETQAITPAGGSEKTYTGSLLMYDDFNPSSGLLILPKEVYALKTNGITSFALSSFSGSGTSRSFNRNGAYTKISSQTFKTFGDIIRVEDDTRTVQSFHPDNLTGIPVATILNAEPNHVVYSNFDQPTAYAFDQTGFFTSDKITFFGRTAGLGLGGWGAVIENLKYLQKTFAKKPGSKYTLSMWYRVELISAGTHEFNIIIKNTGGSQLSSDTLTFTPTVADEWYYGEKEIDLSGIADSLVKVEVRFSGSWDGSSLVFGVVDEVLFYPSGTDMSRSTFNTAHGLLSTTAPDGQITEYERTSAGKLRYLRDHNRDIRQESIITRYSATAVPIPVSFSVEDVIYDNIETHFTAGTGCVNITTLQWKVSPASDPASGSYFNGSDSEPYTFTAPGDYVVWLKVTHASYGTYEYSLPVEVLLAPLEVSICVEEGATEIDLCEWPSQIMETESCEGESLTMVAMTNTTFKAEASGCSLGGTYTYTWYTRSQPGTSEAEVYVGTGQTIQFTNLTATNSYYVHCIVTSSCGKTGISNTKMVRIYRSDPECEGPLAE